jgi:hypothetical protein
MAVSTTQAKRDPLFVATNNTTQHASVEDIQAGHIQQQQVTVTETGNTVSISDAMYSKTNFYIEQTRQYIPSKTLRVFINFKLFPWIMSAIYILQLAFLFVASFMLGHMRTIDRFDYTRNISLACLIVSLIIGISAMLSAVIFFQHLHVVCWTIPWVLRQPVINNLNTGNQHLEVAVTNLEGVYLSARDSGIGLLSETTGKIKFQVLSNTAKSNICWCKYYSIFMAGITILVVIWVVPVFFVSVANFSATQNALNIAFSQLRDMWN